MLTDAIGRTQAAASPARLLDRAAADPTAIASQVAATPAPAATMIAAIDRVAPTLSPVRQGELAGVRDRLAASPFPLGQADPAAADALSGLLAADGDYGWLDRFMEVIRGALTPLPMDLNKVLGLEAAGIVSQSPTLMRELKALEADGWQVEYGTAGAGTFADRSTKTITIDPNGKNDAPGLVQSLAHEVGHASYNPKIDYSSSKAYLRGTLGDEGEATLNNIAVQREIRAAGGPDIGIAGNSANHAAYNAAYDRYLANGDRAAARDAIGKVFGDHERTSTTGQTYRDYYLDGYHRMFPDRK